MTWTLHRGSCLDALTGLATLADKSVDVVVTDPPYEAEAHERGKRQNPGNGGGKEERGKPYKRVVDESYKFAAITEAERKHVAREIARITRKAAAVFCQVEAVDAWRKALAAGGLIYRRAIPWVKPDAMPSLHGRWPGQSVEMIVLAMRAGATAPIGGKARYYEVTRERGETRAHPTAKPLELMRQILEDLTLLGELVADPFMGSASTGVACSQLGRDFVGWEIDAATFAVAQSRINGEGGKINPAQPDLFAAMGGV